MATGVHLWCTPLAYDVTDLFHVVSCCSPIRIPRTCAFISTFWREHWSGVRRTCRTGSGAPAYVLARIACSVFLYVRICMHTQNTLLLLLHCDGGTYMRCWQSPLSDTPFIQTPEIYPVSAYKQVMNWKSCNQIYSLWNSPMGDRTGYTFVLYPI